MNVGLALALAVTTVETADAQDVAADIHINSWPIAGTIHIGDRPRPRAVVVQHVYPRPIIVEHRRGRPPFRDNRWRNNARVIVVYYDPYRHEYFDRYRRGLREMRVYDYDGRFYRYDDGGDYYDHDRRSYRDRDHRGNGRWKRDRDDRDNRRHHDDDRDDWKRNH